jgi:hypothetical protein
MKNADEALKLHLNGLSEFKHDPIKKIPIISKNEWQKLLAECQEHQASPACHAARPRGRPLASESKNNRTVQSFKAAVFVHGEMQVFRAQNGVKRVPRKVKAIFVNIAKQRYPKASEEIVLEYVRKNKKHFPIFCQLRA